jgi:hypothetical protein
VAVRVVEDSTLAIDDDRVVDLAGVERGDPPDAALGWAAAER